MIQSALAALWLFLTTWCLVLALLLKISYMTSWWSVCSHLLVVLEVSKINPTLVPGDWTCASDNNRPLEDSRVVVASLRINRLWHWYFWKGGPGPRNCQVAFFESLYCLPIPWWATNRRGCVEELREGPGRLFSPGWSGLTLWLWPMWSSEPHIIQLSATSPFQVQTTDIYKSKQSFITKATI